jgi:hypothetical protein
MSLVKNNRPHALPLPTDGTFLAVAEERNVDVDDPDILQMLDDGLLLFIDDEPPPEPPTYREVKVDAKVAWDAPPDDVLLDVFGADVGDKVIVMLDDDGHKTVGVDIGSSISNDLVPPGQPRLALSTASKSAWELNEPNGTVAGDLKGNCDGVYHGGVTLFEAGPGTIGEPGIELDGVDGYVQIPDPNAQLVWTDRFRCQAWVRITDATGDFPIFVKGPGDSGHVYFYIHNRHLKLGRGAEELQDAGPQIPLNQWVHVAVDRGSAVSGQTPVRFFVNGVLNSTGDLAAGWPPIGTEDAYIGRWETGPYFKGRLKNVGVGTDLFTAPQLLGARGADTIPELPNPGGVTVVNGHYGGVVNLTAADVGAASAAGLTAEIATRSSQASAETAARAAADSAEAATRASADNAERTARANGDSAEIAARIAAISGEASARIAAIAAEAIARTTADDDLQAQIDALGIGTDGAMSSVLATFTYLDDGPLSGPWSAPVFGTQPMPSVVGGVVQGSYPDFTGAFWNEARFAGTSEVWAIIDDATDEFDLYVLWNPVNNTGYILLWDSTTLSIYRWDNPAGGTALESVTLSLAPGDGVKLTAEAGFLRMWHQPSGAAWTALGTGIVDTNYGAGRIGFDVGASTSVGFRQFGGGGSPALGITGVTNEAAIDPRNEPFNALLDGTRSDHAEVQAAADFAATANASGYGGKMIIPGWSNLTSGITIPYGLEVEGIGAKSKAGFGHAFDGDCLTLSPDGNTTLKNLELDQLGAFSGAAIACYANAVCGFINLRDIGITDYGSARRLGWERDLVIDGSGSSIGIRTVHIDNLHAFGAFTPEETIVLTRVVHCFLDSSEVIAAPQTSVVTGIKILDNFSEDVYLTAFQTFGNVYTEAAQMNYMGRVYQGGTITCGAGSNNNRFFGDVFRASFVNNGGTDNKRIGS